MTTPPPMLECPECGASVPHDAAACPTCGTPVYAACPFCGVERRLSIPTCPRCGQGWFEPEPDADPLVPEARPIGSLAEAWEASEEEDFLADAAWEESDPGWQAPRRYRRSQAAGFLAGLAGLLLLAALTVGAFSLMGPRRQAGPPTFPTTGEGPAEGATETTEATTTTSLALPAFIEPRGDPIPVEELRLTVDGIGPLGFGDPFEEVLGRLVASLGQPAEDMGPRSSDGAFGTCPGQQIRPVRWGPLVVVGVGEPASFAGYRMDLEYGEGGTAAAIETLSGLRVGDTVADLVATYPNFPIDYVEVPGVGTVFELRNSAGQLLVWGPVTSTDPEALVRGIYSPDPCQR